MQALWQDVRFGVRMLMKNRLVSLVCIVALALGIGANAAIFSMAEAFLASSSSLRERRPLRRAARQT